MRKKIYSIVLGCLSFALVFFSCTGCYNGVVKRSRTIKTTTGSVLKKANNLFPIESFVMTKQSFQITSKVCKSEEDCADLVIQQRSVASGVIIKTDTKNSYILTAGHACVPSPPKDVALAGPAYLKYDIEVKTGFGRESKAEVVAVDPVNDLCLLESPDYLGPGLIIQEKQTALHEKVYNMAGPHGLAASLAVPVFDGYYIGTVADKMLFTIPASPGSSGSPVMNKDGEIITIVSAAAIRFDEFAICPDTQYVKKFLLANLPVKKKTKN